jgi:hypothetical protein
VPALAVEPKAGRQKRKMLNEDKLCSVLDGSFTGS